MYNKKNNNSYMSCAIYITGGELWNPNTRNKKSMVQVSSNQKYKRRTNSLHILSSIPWLSHQACLATLLLILELMLLDTFISATRSLGHLIIHTVWFQTKVIPTRHLLWDILSNILVQPSNTVILTQQKQSKIQGMRSFRHMDCQPGSWLQNPCNR